MRSAILFSKRADRGGSPRPPGKVSSICTGYATFLSAAVHSKPALSPSHSPYHDAVLVILHHRVRSQGPENVPAMSPEFARMTTEHLYVSPGVGEANLL